MRRDGTHPSDGRTSSSTPHAEKGVDSGWKRRWTGSSTVSTGARWQAEPKRVRSVVSVSSGRELILNRWRDFGTGAWRAPVRATHRVFRRDRARDRRVCNVSGSGRSRAAIAALVVVSGLASLGALELVVRLTGLGVHAYMDEVQMYGLMLVPDEEGRYLRHPAGASVVLQGVTLRFNSLGMRDDEPRIPKPPGTFRVLCLGDSVTLGPAVPQGQIYPARLRGLLGPGVDVVAAAVAGWNTVAEERFLARHIETLQPDLVVLLYVTNDNEPTEPFRRLRRPATRWSTRLYRALVTRSRLFEWAAFVAARAPAGVQRGDRCAGLRHLVLHRGARPREPHE